MHEPTIDVSTFDFELQRRFHVILRLLQPVCRLSGLFTFLRDFEGSTNHVGVVGLMHT
jgi:hypothetical protein